MIKLKNLSMRIGSVELRTCDIHLLNSTEHVTAEIVKWSDNDKSCFTIAVWRKYSEGFELSFIGNRPIKNCDPAVFFKLVQNGQDHLDEYFDLTYGDIS